MFVISFVLACFFPIVFAPIHEFGHVLFAWITGSSAQMHWSYVVVEHGTAFSFLGGPLAGVLIPAVVVLIAAKRKKERLAWFFYGMAVGDFFGTLFMSFTPENDFGLLLGKYGSMAFVMCVTVYLTVSVFFLFLGLYRVVKMNEEIKRDARLTKKRKQHKLWVSDRKIA